MPMIATGTGAFDGLLLNVADETRYYVESGGVRSGTFTLGVADLPAVDRLAMEYRFPAYSGLALATSSTAATWPRWPEPRWC